MRKIKLIVLCLSLVIISSLITSRVYAEVAGEQPVFKISPSVTVPIISGDREKFEEDNWLSRNVTAGADEFSYSNRLNDTDKVEIEGHALAGNNDYAFNTEFIRSDLGSIHLEFEQFRKYFDGSGGFSVIPATSSAVPRVVDLDRDLYLTLGKFKIGGVLEKEDSPTINLSYERERKDGAKSLTSWSSVESGAIDPKRYPLALDIDEIADTYKLGVSGNVKDVKLSIEQTVEHVEVETSKINNLTVGATGSISAVREKFEDLDFDRYDTVLRLSKQHSEKMFSSFALMFSHFIGGTIEQITDTSTSSTAENHPPNPASIEFNVVTLLKNFSFTPSKGVSFNAAVKGEVSDKNGSSVYDRDRTVPPDGTVDSFKNIKSDTEKKKIAESLGFKYSKIKNIVIFADAEFEQERVRQFEDQNSFGTNPETDIFTRITDTNQYNNDYSIGFKWYPMSKLNLTPQYKFKQRMRDYDHKQVTGDAGIGYSAFMKSMDIYSHIPSLRLNYKPNKLLAYNLSYSYNTDIYEVRTIPSDLPERAKYKSHVASFDVTLTPRDDLFLNLLYQSTRAVTSTMASKSSGDTLLPAYNADYDVLSLAANYSLDSKTVLRGDYSMAKADNYDSNATFLPLGLDNMLQNFSIGAERKLNNNATMDLRYAISKYQEDSNGGFDDYEAHIVTLGAKLIF